MADLMGEMAKDAEGKADLPSTSKLEELSNLIAQMKAAENKVTNLEGQLKEAKKDLLRLSFGQIPDLFDELELSKLLMADGTKVEIKRKFAASISKDNEDACFKWLRDNGHESLIKHGITISLKKGDEKIATNILGALDTMGLSYTDKENVHAQTLAAFVKEQKEAGADFPDDIFKVFPVRTTKLS